ncbi:MAG: hypothetical protein ABEJ99_03400 [Candidatus Nanohaloarchaea archaeon]
MVKYIYTFSSVKNLPNDLIRSVKSLIRYVPPEDIIVYYTPPVDESHMEELDSLEVEIRTVDHISDSFSMTGSDKPSHYGDKLWLCEVEEETVVFLDCDTIVLEDPEKLIEGKFDFKARPGSYNLNRDKWKSLFEKTDSEFMRWMPNTGFMIFKDGVHREISQEWRDYLTNRDLYRDLAEVKHLEQYALALAVSDYENTQMSKNDHVFEWEDEVNSAGVVYHIGKRGIKDPRVLILEYVDGFIPFLDLEHLVRSGYSKLKTYM